MNSLPIGRWLVVAVLVVAAGLWLAGARVLLWVAAAPIERELPPTATAVWTTPRPTATAGTRQPTVDPCTLTLCYHETVTSPYGRVQLVSNCEFRGEHPLCFVTFPNGQRIAGDVCGWSADERFATICNQSYGVTAVDMQLGRTLDEFSWNNGWWEWTGEHTLQSVRQDYQTREYTLVILDAGTGRRFVSPICPAWLRERAAYDLNHAFGVREFCGVPPHSTPRAPAAGGGR